MSHAIYDQETIIYEDVKVSDNDEDFTGWYCVKTEPFPCKCGQTTVYFFTYAHAILVWPDLDDLHMLTMCSVAKDHGRNPKVVQYKNEYGKCISYYEAISNPHISAHG